MLKRKTFVEIGIPELQKIVKEGGECFQNHLDIVEGAYGTHFRIRYYNDGRVQFQNREKGQWHLIGEEPNHVHYVESILCKDKGGCKACKGK